MPGILEIAGAGVLLAILTWIIGMGMGCRVERRAWTMRAMSKDKPYNSTPHHCEGEFYYVITEKHFCEEFQRRHKETDECST